MEEREREMGTFESWSGEALPLTVEKIFTEKQVYLGKRLKQIFVVELSSFFILFERDFVCLLIISYTVIVIPNSSLYYKGLIHV